MGITTWRATRISDFLCSNDKKILHFSLKFTYLKFPSYLFQRIFRNFKYSDLSLIRLSGDHRKKLYKRETLLCMFQNLYVLIILHTLNMIHFSAKNIF